MQIRKEEVKWSLFAGDTILYLKDQRNATIKFLDIINTFSNVTGYKNQFKKSIAFLYTKDEQTEKEYRNTIPFTLDSKI
jgi:DNA-directed RNA polymerase delta subunit